MKLCRNCKIEKQLDAFYKHPQMGNGYLNICKECIKSNVKQLYQKKKKNQEYVQAERKRGRDKYYRLGYKTRTSAGHDIANRRWREKNREKQKAMGAVNNAIKVGCIKKQHGKQCHHWSYLKEHHLDIIFLNINLHSFIHRFLSYDKEKMMFRTSDNLLLDTKEKHVQYIECLEKVDYQKEIIIRNQ